LWGAWQRPWGACRRSWLEQEEVAARHRETLEELTRLKEAAERESQALGASSSSSRRPRLPWRLC